MKQYTYTVIIHPCAPDEGGYWVEVPALQGCLTQGQTIEEAIAMAKDAISGYIQSLMKHHEPIPVETNPLGTVITTVAVDEPVLV
ncbi:MAG: type II toxin-antitoxin system HicB family antitoxin [Phycisphaeraceae bacterium]